MGRLRSGMRVSASFQIIPPSRGSGLGSGLYVVSRLGSGPQAAGRLGSKVWASDSFQMFALVAQGKIFQVGREIIRRGNVPGNVPEGEYPLGKCPTLRRTLTRVDERHAVSFCNLVSARN